MVPYKFFASFLTGFLHNRPYPPFLKPSDSLLPDSTIPGYFSFSLATFPSSSLKTLVLLSLNAVSQDSVFHIFALHFLPKGLCPDPWLR